MVSRYLLSRLILLPERERGIESEREGEMSHKGGKKERERKRGGRKRESMPVRDCIEPVL